MVQRTWHEGRHIHDLLRRQLEKHESIGLFLHGTLWCHLSQDYETPESGKGSSPRLQAYYLTPDQDADIDKDDASTLDAS